MCNVHKSKIQKVPECTCFFFIIHLLDISYRYSYRVDSSMDLSPPSMGSPWCPPLHIPGVLSVCWPHVAGISTGSQDPSPVLLYHNNMFCIHQAAPGPHHLCNGRSITEESRV